PGCPGEGLAERTPASPPRNLETHIVDAGCDVGVGAGWHATHMGWWIRLRRALWLLIAFLTVARPVGAATGTSSQIDQARHQLAVAGATVTQLDRRIAGLDRS